MSKEHKEDLKEQAEANREYLSEIFDDYAQEIAPETLKEEVFSTLDSIQFTADIFDLFTIKFGKTEGMFLKGLTGTENKGFSKNNTKE